MRKAKPKAKPKARKRFPVIILLLLLAIVFGLAGGAYWTLYRPLPRSAPETVNITAKTTLTSLANALQTRKIIPNALAFRIYARLTGHSKIKEGVYTVTSGMRPVDMLTSFIGGRSMGAAVTIPEGKWASEISELLKKNWPEAAAKMPEIVANPTAWKDKVPFPLETSTLEGYLFPDTYHFPPGATAEQITETMLKNFEEKCWKDYQQHPPADKRSLHQVLTLASLVESEARKDDERAKIAGVYMNRIAKGMTLDCDATLIYAKKIRVTRVLNADKKVDSPYNTYTHRGMPPGPICNPGQKSFLAALQPESVPFYYYVAQSDGSHLFAVTLDEQTANIRKVQGR